MGKQAKAMAIVAAEAPPRERASNYPEPFASRMAGRIKRPLGDLFGLTNFGVNLTTLAPGAVSSLRHAHSRQDELVYILEGSPTLVTNEGETVLAPGMAAGFKARQRQRPPSDQPHRSGRGLSRGRRPHRARRDRLSRRRHPRCSGLERPLALRAQGRAALRGAPAFSRRDLEAARHRAGGLVRIVHEEQGKSGQDGCSAHPTEIGDTASAQGERTHHRAQREAEIHERGVQREDH